MFLGLVRETSGIAGIVLSVIDKRTEIGDFSPSSYNIAIPRAADSSPAL